MGMAGRFALLASVVAALAAPGSQAQAPEPCQGLTPTKVGNDLNNTLTGTAGVDVIAGLGGNDTISGLGGNDVICGGPGNDTIRGGPGKGNIDGEDGDDKIYGDAGDDALAGDAGADWLDGGADADDVFGGTGNDVISEGAGPNGKDALFGGADVDEVTYGLRYTRVVVTVDGLANDGGLNEQDNVALNVERVRGGFAGDLLTGSTSADELFGNGGNDTLIGLGGNDLLAGGEGGDTLDGGLGADTLLGGNGIDTASWADRLRRVVVDVDGVADDGDPADPASGEGDNVLADVENLAGGAGDDSLAGNGGINRLTGNGGADTLSGLGGNDTLLGLAGNDGLVGGAGSDTLDGGLGVDDASFADSPLGVRVNLLTSVATGHGTDRLLAVEDVTGSALADDLTGNAGPNVLRGGSGNDRLSGLAGDDVLDGGTGDDSLLGGPGADHFAGGAGVDTASWTDHVFAVRVDADGVADDGDPIRPAGGEHDNVVDDVENLVGGPGADELTGSAFANQLRGNAGNDVLSGLGDADELFGDAGNDVLNGGDHRDLLVGGLGADVLQGGAGLDTGSWADHGGAVVVDLDGVADDGSVGERDNANADGSVENVVGGPAGDTLSGGIGANVLTGGAGNDVFGASPGDDTLDGGTGIDKASFATAPGAVTVDLAAGTATGFGADSLLAIENVDGSPFDDVLVGNALNNVLAGMAGADSLRGGPGVNTLNGGPDFDDCAQGPVLIACEWDRTAALKLELPFDFDYVDPAHSYFTHAWQLQDATCARLVTYPDATPPSGGAQLVPDAALALPTISADGKTYTFRIRAGLGFSPPSTQYVTAASFKTAFDRVRSPALLSPGASFVQDVVSIVASGNTLTFTLANPAGDFLARLAMPFFCAVPVGTPVTPTGHVPIPSAGPYYLASYPRGARAVALRNPRYPGPRARTFAAIEWTFGKSLDEIRTRVEAGVADTGPFPPAAAEELHGLYGPGTARQRYFLFTNQTLWYIALNAERVFADEKLRQAVSTALDRRHLASLHGYDAGQPTDQHLAPGMPGYADRDLFDLDGDLAAALLLAEEAGVTPENRISVTFYAFSSSPGPEVAEYVQAALEPLGIDVEIETFTRTVQHEKMGTRGEPFDLGLAGWGADYLDPFNVLDVLLNGGRIQDANNTNQSYFTAFDARLDAAAALTGAARSAEYADLDNDLATASPVVTYINTNARLFFSDRIGCHAFKPLAGVPLNALCLR
jgi:Ca2+-binding RTX toxin-like protein